MGTATSPSPRAHPRFACQQTCVRPIDQPNVPKGHRRRIPSITAAMAAGPILYSAATLLSAASISALLVDGTLAPDVSSLDMTYLYRVWIHGFRNTLKQVSH